MSNLIKKKPIHRVGSVILDFLDFLSDHISTIILSILFIAILAVPVISTINNTINEINEERNQLGQERHITISRSDGTEIFSYQGNFLVSEEDKVKKQGLFGITKEYFKDIKIYNSQGTLFQAQLDDNVIITIEYIDTEYGR